MEKEIKELVNVMNTRYFKKLIEVFQIRISKTQKISEYLREEANEMFRRKYHDAALHEEIWKFYTMSVAVAENNSELLALAYGNRAAILLHLCKYEPCIDVDRALSISNNDYFKVKLCMKVLNSPECNDVIKETEIMMVKISNKILKKQLEELLNKSKNVQDRVKIEKKPRDYDNMLKDLHKKHVTNDFSAVEIAYTEKFGRHLIATRNIKPGEVIYVEEPYIKSVSMKKQHAYCSYCFSTKWANIPCEHCSWTMFCSEQCKKDAWEKYHDIECALYAMSQSDDNKNNSYRKLAIRALILALKEAGSIENLEKELKAFDENTDFKKGFMQDGKIQPSGFKTIYSLVHNVSVNSIQKHTINAALVLKGLGKTTSYYGENFVCTNFKDYKKNKIVIFLGSLYLKLSKISQINSHQMWNGNYVCRNQLDRLSCWRMECCSRGVYIAPVTALLNHSCDPNARRCYSNDHKVILYAIKPIKKGAQIFDCYQQEFYELDVIPRQQELAKRFNFECDCEACIRKWPHLQNFFNFSGERMQKNMAEIKLAIEYKDLIPSTMDPNRKYDEKTIANLGRGIEKGVKLPPPSFTNVNLIICLNTIFERIYGIKLNVPSTCNV